ncbi:hypothetical protein [Bosea sp. AK1]|uniref:hypothetical protein n=1 Tax=Bosea sp. AK1 TaxID=2587160 RepID=UPI001151FC80|nr:hypothetical protein [Bosea sp. AK1]
MNVAPKLRCVATARATGQRCKAIRVRGHSCCRMHGGGAAAVKRYREELHAICTHKRRGKVRAGRLEWLVQRLAKTDRNRPRAYNAGHERAYAAEAERLMGEVSQKGATALARAVHATAVVARPYCPVDCLLASARLALGWIETRSDIERVMLVQEFVAALGANAVERERARAMLAPVLGWRGCNF